MDAIRLKGVTHLVRATLRAGDYKIADEPDKSQVTPDEAAMLIRIGMASPLVIDGSKRESVAEEGESRESRPKRSR